MTAVALASRIFMEGRRNDPWRKAAAQAILHDPPLWDPARKTVDSYYWYYAALALFQHDAPSGPAWKALEASMRKALLPSQRPRAARGQTLCAGGSWDPEVDRWGSVGGRVYTTAINVLTLEVYYRYENLSVSARGAGAK